MKSLLMQTLYAMPHPVSNDHAWSFWRVVSESTKTHLHLIATEEGARMLEARDTDLCVVLPPNRITWYAFNLGNIAKKYRHRTLLAKLNEQSLQADHERVVFVTEDLKNSVVWCAVVDKNWLQQTIRELQSNGALKITHVLPRYHATAYQGSEYVAVSYTDINPPMVLSMQRDTTTTPPQCNSMLLPLATWTSWPEQHTTSWVNLTDPFDKPEAWELPDAMQVGKPSKKWSVPKVSALLNMNARGVLVVLLSALFLNTLGVATLKYSTTQATASWQQQTRNKITTAYPSIKVVIEPRRQLEQALEKSSAGINTQHVNNILNTLYQLTPANSPIEIEISPTTLKVQWATLPDPALWKNESVLNDSVQINNSTIQWDLP